MPSKPRSDIRFGIYQCDIIDRRLPKFKELYLDKFGKIQRARYDYFGHEIYFILSEGKVKTLPTARPQRPRKSKHVNHQL